MDRRSRKPSDLDSRFESRRGATAWLYDTRREDFLEDPGVPEELWSEIVFNCPSQRRQRPASRPGRLLYWLFDNGGMSVVFVFGLIAFALLCALVGVR